MSVSPQAPIGGKAKPLSVSEDGSGGRDSVAADDEGDRRVIIGAGRTETVHAVPTVDDGADGPDGMVTLTLNPGAGHTTDTAPAGVPVTDNDGPPQSGSSPPCSSPQCGPGRPCRRLHG